ncbi:FG-GAP repeat domain-containing protein [Cyclobacterium marinum]|uniref:FG-GAP repeat protein n=1 Tax=Cyclobacterium marinum (strain ATCC 25205 / DSM 745 / LMG 13164 / NCIMB 1802) TaxID=880070 RepID=G0J0G8_CYCMS|nr:VCBS repeat-containing protein [Cyclobacterium marinum]AEL23884.1 FG-GAP repeat protein [Cyclobacterium marinum DSM 745]
MIEPIKTRLPILAIGSLFLFSCEADQQAIESSTYRDDMLHKLAYNNPGLLVDLDAGFKAVPMPMDFDGDGDLDLLISESGSYTESGIFYFENITGNTEMPVFRRRMKVSFERRRLGDDGSRFQTSYVGEGVHVLTPDRVREKLLIYKNVPQNVFWDENEVHLPDEGYDYLHNCKTEWKIIDFDGDGVYDLMAVATRDKPRTYRGKLGKAAEKLDFVTDGKNHVLFLKNSGTNEDPVYENPQRLLKSDGSPLSEGLSMKPMFADFDNDGDYDFLSIGKNHENFDIDWNDDFIIYFENTGSATEYEFGQGRALKMDGLPIQYESRATMHQTAIDWNRDGFMDILAGDEDGKISYLRNTGEMVDGLPQFAAPVFIQQEAKYVDFGALVAPRIFDWDDDGLDDIISGNAVGNIGFIKNLGGKDPVWDAPKLLEVDGEPIRLIQDEALPNTERPFWGYSTIDVGYWDEDDLPDILANEHNGNIVFFKNTGSKKAPKLAAPQPLYVEWEGEPLRPAWVPGVAETDNELLAPWRTSPLIMDFNEDGLNDLVMLDHEGYLAVYPRKKVNDKLVLTHPQRNFVFPDGQPIFLNQRTGSSSGRLKITFHDWDGDGLEDLIVSSKPAVDWMKNKGMKDGKLVLEYMGRVLSKTLMGHTDGPVVSDFNQDGVPDLVVGTETGQFYYWQRSSFDITSTMTTEGKQGPAKYPYFKR